MNQGVGQAVAFTTYDATIKRSRCGSCARVVATGQQRCVCGAQLRQEPPR